MSKAVFGSQKFASLEIVDSAKFDNEIVYGDLSMSGKSLSIVCSEDVTISSTSTSTPWGVNILSVGPVTSSSTQSTNWVLAGFNDGVAPTSGTVGLGHSTDGNPVGGLLVEFESVSGEVRLGTFGATPVAQPTTAIPSGPFSSNSSGIVDDSATFSGYTIGQVVNSLRELGLLA